MTTLKRSLRKVKCCFVPRSGLKRAIDNSDRWNSKGVHKLAWTPSLSQKENQIWEDAWLGYLTL